MEGGKLDKSQFIVSPESTTDRSPRLLPSSTDRLGARARGQHYQSTRSCPQDRFQGGRESENQTENRESVVPLNTRVLGLKSLLCCAIVSDHASDCQSSGKVSAFKRSRGCSGRGIVVLGLVFLSDQKTCAPLPFPHPNLSLFYYRLRGAQCAARQAARFVSEHCPWSPRTLFPGLVRAAGYHGAGLEGSDG